MPRVRFEHTIPVFEQAKTIDSAAIVLGFDLSIQKYTVWVWNMVFNIWGETQT
jgi:hypothetical protein